MQSPLLSGPLESLEASSSKESLSTEKMRWVSVSRRGVETSSTPAVAIWVFHKSLPWARSVVPCVWACIWCWGERLFLQGKAPGFLHLRQGAPRVAVAWGVEITQELCGKKICTLETKYEQIFPLWVPQSWHHIWELTEGQISKVKFATCWNWKANNRQATSRLSTYGLANKWWEVTKGFNTREAFVLEPSLLFVL